MDGEMVLWRGAVAVILAGIDEVRQHVVRVGGADELFDGQAHLAGVIAGQDVPEVARGNAEEHTLARFDALGGHGVGIGFEIVDDLRYQAAPVDGVGRGKGPAESVEPFRQFLVVEDFLDAALGVVEVAFDAEDLRVAAGLGGHLEFLHVGADAVFGIKDDDFRAGHIGETFQGGFARIARRGRQDDDTPFFPGLFPGPRHQVRQDLQGHVLESHGRAVPQFQDIRVFGHLVQHDGFLAELFFTVGGQGAFHQLFPAIVRQEPLQDLDGRHGIRLAVHGQDFFQRKLGETLGHEQAPVRGQAVADGMGRGNQVPAASRTYI